MLGLQHVPVIFPIWPLTMSGCPLSYFDHADSQELLGRLFWNSACKIHVLLSLVCNGLPWMSEICLWPLALPQFCSFCHFSPCVLIRLKPNFAATSPRVKCMLIGQNCGKSYTGSCCWINLHTKTEDASCFSSSGAETQTRAIVFTTRHNSTTCSSSCCLFCRVKCGPTKGKVFLFAG